MMTVIDDGDFKAGERCRDVKELASEGSVPVVSALKEGSALRCVIAPFYRTILSLNCTRVSKAPVAG